MRGINILKNRLKNIQTKQCIFIIEIIFMLIICFLHAIDAGHYANFSAINGTFQNYNPVRRFLAGQIPYRDFQDYLGIGHLYIGSIATVIFGGDYQRSLMAFSFLTIFSLALLSTTIGHAIFQNKNIALGSTNVVLALLLKDSLILSGGGVSDEIKEALAYALVPGNSARLIRGMILPVACILLFYFNYLHTCIAYKKILLGKYKKYIEPVAIGMIAGFAFIWSNDYGISCWFCLIIMSFIFAFSKFRRIKQALLNMSLVIFSSIIWIFVFIEILTLGHFKNWFMSIFGTGGYQGWYYNNTKSYFIYQLDLSFLVLVQAFLCLFYIIRLFNTHAKGCALTRYGIPAFANMVSFCAINEYQLLSGGGLYQVAFAVLFFTVLYEILLFIGSLGKTKKIYKLVIVTSMVMSLALIISDFKDEVFFWKLNEKDGKYVSQMGGSMTYLGDDLINTSQFLNGKSFFATYASAQEVMEDTFQPSGTDYIIHVLGDSSREKYMDSFKNGDFTYAATIKPTYTPWEYWVQRANWFFYRELYNEWHPVYSNSYEVYWERNEEESYVLKDEFEIKVKNIDKSTKKIIVNADQSINGIADVYIDYSVKKKDRKLSKLSFRKVLKVKNTGVRYSKEPNDSIEKGWYESNYLRDSGSEYIPIPVVNGYGEVTLTSFPESATYLELYESSCKSIYQVVSSYVEVISVKDSLTETKITVDKNEFNKDILKDIKEVVINEEEYQVIEVEEKESCYIVHVLNKGKPIKKENDILKSGNMFQIKK